MPPGASKPATYRVKTIRWPRNPLTSQRNVRKNAASFFRRTILSSCNNRFNSTIFSLHVGDVVPRPLFSLSWIVATTFCSWKFAPSYFFSFFLWRKRGKIENWPWSKRIFSLSFSLDIEEIARFLGLLLFLSLFFFYQNTSRITFCYVEMIKFVYFYVDNRNSFLP